MPPTSSLVQINSIDSYSVEHVSLCKFTFFIWYIRNYLEALCCAVFVEKLHCKNKAKKNAFGFYDAAVRPRLDLPFSDMNNSGTEHNQSVEKVVDSSS